MARVSRSPCARLLNCGSTRAHPAGADFVIRVDERQDVAPGFGCAGIPAGADP